MAAGLTKQEQLNVRVALRALSVRNGGLALLASRMEASQEGLSKAMYGMRGIGAMTAIRIAQMAGVPVEDVLTGRYPDATVCRHCGHAMYDQIEEESGDVH